MSQIWVVDDDPSVRFVVERALDRAGHSVRGFASLAPARQALQEERPELLITDIRLDDGNGLELLNALPDQGAPPVIVMTAYGNLDNAVAAYRGGAFEYLAKPFDLAALQAAVQRALQDEARVTSNEEEAQDGMIGRSPPMQELFRSIGRLSTTDVNVLITGETGVGKELVAKALHRHSPRSNGQFVAINTAAVPSELLESELFGHEKGAFTGAVQRHQGRFEQAQGGSLFLDEIGDMPLALQTRLLRVLAEGDFYRVGGRDLLKADVRIIAATHQDLHQRVADQAFRADLFHRLNVVQIRVAPLRERCADIPLLAAHFLRECSSQLGLEQKQFAPAALTLLAQAPWPGNVRELKNLCQHLLVMAPGEVILPADLPLAYRGQDKPHSEQPGVQAAIMSAAADSVPAPSLPAGAMEPAGNWQQALHHSLLTAAREGGAEAVQSLRNTTRQVLMQGALAHCGGRVGAAAELLGVGRNTLSRWLKQD